jgi:exodeoxyribonuclease VII large subunit
MESLNVNSISLLELNQLIKEKLADAFPTTIWVRAEISEFRENANGHCYLELIDKDEKSDRIAAKTKAMIWSSTYKMLKLYFESTTDEALGAGLKILAACSIEFHEVYGISLVLHDIDPTFTLGEMAIRRQQLLKQLEAEGMLNMNKQLPFAILPQRIAVISSATAAGYGDFLDQLHANRFKYVFYARLFPAVMQGEQTERSVIAALDAVYAEVDHFDVVVILRGGGAVADLSSFDRYLLALHCVQFPLPILTGIGHFRDDTLIDHLAYASLKTPTAVAEFLIDKIDQAHELLLQSVDKLAKRAFAIHEAKTVQLQNVVRKFPPVLLGRTGAKKMDISRKLSVLQRIAMQQLSNRQQKLNHLRGLVQSAAKQQMSTRHHTLELMKNQLIYVNPLSILEKGYCLASLNGKRVHSKSTIQPGDSLKIGFHDGTVITKVTDS